VEEGPLSCVTCEAVTSAPAIRAVWTTSDRVYWTEYGTFDELENYQNDGRLMAMSLAGGEPVVIASGLQGPTWVAVGEKYAYVWLRHSTSLDGVLELSRVSLESGDVELLQGFLGSRPYYTFTRDPTHQAFAFGGGYAYWWKPDDDQSVPVHGAIYRISESNEGPAEKWLESDAFTNMLAGDTVLYLTGTFGLQAVPYAGGEPELVSMLRTESTTIANGAFYGFEPLNYPQCYTVTMPIAGGTFQRIAKFNQTYLPEPIVTDGTSFVGALRVNQPGARELQTLVEGDLKDVSSAKTLATMPGWPIEDSAVDSQYAAPGDIYPSVRAWAATPTTIYLGYGDKLYRIPRRQ
jgi:hypothetical protein